MDEKQKVIKREYIARIRVIYLLLCFVISLVSVIAISIYNELLIDQTLCLVFVTIVFAIVVEISIMHKRNRKELVDFDTSYGRLCLRVLYCWIIIIAGNFIPEFFVPVALLPIILTTVCPEMVSLSISLYMVICLSYVHHSNNLVIICYVLLVLVSQATSSYMKTSEDKMRADVLVIIFTSNVIITLICYYLSNYNMSISILIFSLILGGLCTAFFGFLFNILLDKSIKDHTNKYGTILNKNYSLVKDIRNYSLAEYTHAVKVSNLSRECAKVIGANDLCAACGGFYYRLGRMEGEPEIDNAIRLATANCFPRDVITIMSEYGGIISKPSTPESAIVHMVDTLVTKIELLDRDTMSSSWNQDMVIYQTLNDYSQAGFYDNSGLSMNQFLKVRQRLVNEESFI
ncbi:MAG: hypothetical protein K5644_05380 [Lachnospiraceae bacterium]|nr:hypothetical protein [Lachnospiraceae bacterium]